MLELACLSGWMYCICVSLFALHVSLFALPCLHYLRLNPASWAMYNVHVQEHFLHMYTCAGTLPTHTCTCTGMFELACLSGWMYCICVSLFALHVSLFALLCLHYLRLNPASWAALVAQLAEHWTSNPVVTGSNLV